MDRRAFISTLAGGLLAAPLAVEAQPPPKGARLGLLSAGASGWRPPSLQGFVKRMRELGWVEGQNLEIKWAAADGKLERLPYLASELAEKVDLILAPGNELALKAAREATTTIPVVIVAIDYDPLARGYVASLARPGANITGIFLRQPELTLKRLELLTETLPRRRQIAVLWDALSVDQLKAARALGSSAKVDVQAIELRDGDLEAAIREAALGSDGAVILASTFVYRDRDRLAQLALKHRLPTISAYREYAESGGLMTYGADLPAMFGRAADYVDKILKGAKPADFPIEQPTKFELVINLKTAKALGLTIPPSLLQRADQVIE